MKRKLVKSLVTGALVFAVASSPLFADGANRSRKPGLPVQQRNERCACQGKKADFKKQGASPKKMGNKKNGEMKIGKPDLLGTVSAVNQESSIMTVRDADGKETLVHVNPLTKLNARTPKAEGKKKQKEERIGIADVKPGDWVMVKKIDTDTKTLEAGRIFVTK
ncbi:MAG: hypothetical protein II921_01730 [Treponema sp.]|nr:hypothetical protein [Treponema sp.]